MKKKIMCALLSCVTALGISCKSKDTLDVHHGIADQSKLYGMCYLMEERNLNEIDVEKEALLMKNLGVKTVRQWMHFTHFMSNSTTIKECTALTKMHEFLRACSDNGMTNIGMNHHNFCSTTSKASTTAKPYTRDVSEGSNYVKWLEEYYVSWKTLVTEFPEVTYWEVDNEVNNPDFMCNGSVKYTVQEMCDIATDMFYYASRGIHEANPNAVVVMGSLTEPSGLGTGNSISYLNKLYANIKSGDFGYFYWQEDQSKASKNADDYFEIACWHPYMSRFNKENFITLNNEFYQIIIDNEGKHKKVFFTEFGWNDSKNKGEENVIKYLGEFFEALKEMPYVETANYFKLYDNGTKNNWDGPDYLYYGLFHDPNTNHVYTPYVGEVDPPYIDALGNCITGAPKNKAYAFQQIAHGSGDLTLLMDTVK